MSDARIALVTGANQGLGFALAAGLAARMDPDDLVLLTGRHARRVADAAAAVTTRAGTRSGVIGRVLDVAELARARAFYEALGWRGAKQPDDEVCFFQAGGMVFGLWTALGGHGAPGIELAHNVRTPEDVGASTSRSGTPPSRAR